MAFFPQALFGGKYLLSGDAFFYSYPLRTVAWGMVRHGELPLWTPYVLSGYPLLSMAQIGLGYPLTWGYFFLPGHVAEQIYVLAPFLLAPIFTYFYLRQINRTILASLLGALTFGYGGLVASPLANNGLLSNAVMWMPLMLIAFERARYRRFVPCLLGATAAYTMSVLTGIGQGFLYVGLLGGIYSLFLVLRSDAEQRSLRMRLKSLNQWRPLLVAGGSILFSIGVAAFQILETARAVRRSVRNTLTYDLFTQGSFAPSPLLKSNLAPLFYPYDVHSYVLPLALALAGVSVYAYWRNGLRRDSRVLFWLATAIVALILMLGAYTPFYRVIYHLPLLNRFRVPARHTFEWTFAVAVLASYGWEVVADWVRRLRTRHPRSEALTRGSAIILLAAAVGVGAAWWLRVQTLQILRPYPTGRLAPPVVYCLWKIVFVLLTAGALWRAALVTSASWRKTLIVATLLVLCYAEPSALVYRWWANSGLPAARFKTQSGATEFLKHFPVDENRVYTRVGFTEEFESHPRFDCANVSAIWGLHNVAGYEPLILDRYSRALGGVGPDSVLRFSSPTPDDSLFGERSRVLDILNTSFVVSYSNLAFVPEPGVFDGNIFTDVRLPSEVQPKATATLTVAPTGSDSLLLVTSLANSVLMPQGSTVARVRIHTTEGLIEREIRAGMETAEWAHERPDVRRIIKHGLAPIFDSAVVKGAPDFPAYRYKTLLTFNRPARVTEVEITNVTPSVPLGIYSASLINSQAGIDLPLGFKPADNWQSVYEKDETLIMRDARAQPRAWLVSEAEAVDGEEALRRIRGESSTDFDPRRTALLEMRPDQLPQLPGGTLSPDSTARITSYQPNRLQVQTNAPIPTILILSEIFYPGWVASVDGRPAQIYLTDYLLRGVALPSGQHAVEMHYTAPAARNGAIISGFTLLVIAALGIYAWRTRG
ncbi:MAG TPA: YfhO family protein [Pyrinomonadaceae bacterium]